MIVYKCDLCGEIKDCGQKRIDGREYDVCSDCWAALEEKLKGKGRRVAERETVFLPQRTETPREPEREEPAPGAPPKIWYGSDRPS